MSDKPYNPCPTCRWYHRLTGKCGIIKGGWCALLKQYE